MEQGAKIFISYSHQDNMCAKGIARYLQRHGYHVWIDSEQLILGKEWAASVDKALEESDAVIAILSANSVRRREVLREISITMERIDSSKVEEKRCNLYFVAVGDIHSSWFGDYNSDNTKKILQHLQRYQYVRLDAKGNITIRAMEHLMKVLHSVGLLQNATFSPIYNDEYNEYIYENGVPEKAYDNEGNNFYYKVRPSDLSLSTVFPFALDNQWLPDEVIKNSELKSAFLSIGFASEMIKEFMLGYQRECLYLSLFHSRQIIINKASLLNSSCLQRYYIPQEDEEREFWDKERKAFKKLIQSGSIILFLYGDDEISPFVNTMPLYSTEEVATRAWNKLCRDVSPYCIRENWDNPKDEHSIELLKFCTTLAINKEKNMMLAKNFRFNEVQLKEFLSVLKAIEMQVYCQTHMNGVGQETNISGYSRSSFYKSYVVKEKNECKRDPVRNCLVDENKPFAFQLKKIVDVYYNSIFSNYFKCWALFPKDTNPEDSFIHQMYLTHGDKEVSLEELEYAFSEFFEYNNIGMWVQRIGEKKYIDNWDLDKILEFRNKYEWHSYIEILEEINRRSTTWKVDFNEIETLVKRFATCFNEETCVDSANYAYTFRLTIGSKVLDIVWTPKVKKLKEYSGDYFSKGQNSLTIQFQIGDTSIVSDRSDIFLPVNLFDGKTENLKGEDYYQKLCNFFIEQCDFVWISN